MIKEDKELIARNICFQDLSPHSPQKFMKQVCLARKLIKQRIRRCDSPTLRYTTPITLNYSQGEILRTPNCGMSAFFNPQKPTAEGQRWSFPTMSLSPYACVQDCLARQHYSFCLQAHQSLTDLRLKRRKGN